MYVSTRRSVMLSGVALALFGCSSTTGTPLQMAKVYGDDLADALSASADVLLASTNPPPTAAQIKIIQTAKADIQAARAALDAANASLLAPVSSDAVTAAKTIIADAQTLEPFVAPLLGPAALYLPLALGVLQAFVDSLPPPPTAPPVPPAALHAKAAAYRRKVGRKE